MPLTCAFTKWTVVYTFPKPRHEITAVATICAKIGFELGNGHIILIHLHSNKDMLKFGYSLLNFLVDDNGTWMIDNNSILPLGESNTMP